MSTLKIKTVTAAFILGILVGAACFNLLTGHRLDKAELEIRQLRAELDDKTEQLANLEKKLAVKNKASVVEDVDVQVIFKDEYEKIEISSAVEKLLKSVQGKEVKSLDPLLVANIVDGRTISTASHKYTLFVKGTLISETIIMYVEAKQIFEQTI